MKKIMAILVSVFLTIELFAWTTPILVSPSDGASQWTGTLFDWNAVIGSQQYQFQIDTSPSFNSPVLFNLAVDYITSSSGNSDTEYYLDNLFFGQTYHWRVRAYVSGDTSAWAERTFTTLDYVSLSSPSTGSLSWTGLTLDWSAHAGVDFYDLELDTSPSFNSPALITSSTSYINSSSGNSDTEHYLDNLFFGKTYYWHVRARNSVDTSSWGQNWTFTTLDYVSLSYPVDGSLTWTGLTLDWDAHAGVDFYDLELDTSPSFNSPALITSSTSYINSSSGNSDTEHYLDNLFFGKTYYWHVRARNSVDTSSWGQNWTFTTLDYVSLSYPSDGQVNVNINGITLDWDAHTGIETYQLQFDTVNAFNSPFLTLVNNNYINSSSGNSDTEYPTGTLFTNQCYYWRVRAINSVDTSSWTTYVFSTGSVISNVNLEQFSNNKILVFPNPSFGVFTVDNLPSKQLSSTKIEIINSIGQIIKLVKPTSRSILIDLSKETKELYFVKIISNDETIIKKIVLD